VIYSNSLRSPSRLPSTHHRRIKAFSGTMVLNINNNIKSCNSSSSSSSSYPDCGDDDDDNWEIVDNDVDVGCGDGQDGLNPLQHHADTNDLELECEGENAEDQAQRVEEVKNTVENNTDDEDASIEVESAVSSITMGGCRATVSDVDDDNMGELEGGDGLECEVTANAEHDENTLLIIEQLSNMGFAKENIVNSIRELRNSGETEIDADAIIGTMLGEEHTTAAAATNNGGPEERYQPTHPLQLPLECTLDYLNSTMQELKDQHEELRHRAKNCVDSVSQSARDIWSNVLKEKDNALPLLLRRRRGSNNSNNRDANAGDTTPDGNNEPTSSSSNQHNRYAAAPSSAGATTRTTILESIRRANDEHHIAEKFAAIAVVGGATLLALGHPRASLGAVAVAGASLAVGEGMVRQQQQGQQQQQFHEEEELRFHQSSPTRDYGLGREDLHLD
jgi:hypothetical protein